jgi:hypothetical protein
VNQVEARVNRVEASVDWIGARDQPGFWRASAGMLAALGDFRGAQAALTRARELAPDDPQLLRELVGAFMAELAAHRTRGEPAPEDLTAGAIELLEEMFRREPDRPLDRALLASLLEIPLSGDLRQRLDALQVGTPAGAGE